MIYEFDTKDLFVSIKHRKRKKISLDEVIAEIGAHVVDDSDATEIVREMRDRSSMDEAELIKRILHVVSSTIKKVWIDYDEEADVLYVSFVYPPNAIEHEMDEDGIVRNYDKEGKLTGLTIIAAKRFAEEAAA